VAKAPSIATGRLPSLRLFSTLLKFPALIVRYRKYQVQKQPKRASLFADAGQNEQHFDL
jgi:hypothetical protein